MSSSSSSQDRRRRLADLEEGERAPGYHSSSDTEDYYNRDTDDYYNRDTVSWGDSDDTISDIDATASSVVANLYGAGTSASSAATNHYGRASASSSVAAPLMACRVCRKEFVSEKAVCGHMKVHRREALHGRKDQGNGKDKNVEKRNVEVTRGWGVTGRRGRSATGTSMHIVKDSPTPEPDQSMDTVPADPNLVYQPTPMASAMPENSSSVSMASARTNLSGGESSSKKPMQNDDMDIAEEGANPNPVANQQAASPPAAGMQAPLVHHNPAVPPPTGRRNPNGYRCADPTCNMWFSTFQALGGHVAAHKNNRRAAAAGMHQEGASKPAKQHLCKYCHAEFAQGVQLGGHMRKHRPIVPKRLRLIEPLPQAAEAEVAPGPAVPRPADVHVDELTRSLTINEESPSLAPAVGATQPAPAAAAAAEGTPEPEAGPRVTGRVMLFGVDIGLAVQTRPGQEASPATKDSSSPSTGEQE